jgi:3,4-dehydroadipyl-CoA semialdehyde dehydrogenase
MLRVKHLLGGVWVDGEGEGVALRDPISQQVLATTSAKGVGVAEPMAWARRGGGETLRSMTFGERARLLGSWATALRAGRDRYYELALANMGANRRDAVYDIDGGIAALRFYAGIGERLGDVRALLEPGRDALSREGGFLASHLWTTRRGLAVHINAFNFPAWGMLEKVAVAVLAGMPALVKPATQTSLLAYQMVEDLHSQGLIPEGVLSLLATGGRELLDLVEEEDCVAFTGSADTAVSLRSNRNLIAKATRFNAEADSLNAILALDDVRPGSDTLDALVEAVVTEVVIKAGQKCTAIRRVIVPDALADEVADRLAERLRTVVVGDPRDPEVEMGPLVSVAQQEAVLAGIALLSEEGKHLLPPPSQWELRGADPRRSAVVPPALVRVNDPFSAKLVHDLEVFGPCVSVLGYRSREEGIELVRRGRGSLVASVVTEDPGRFVEVVSELGSLHGRLNLLDATTRRESPGHGVVMPQGIHGGPGRAGGGEELGGLRGLRFYLQRTAIEASAEALDALGAVTAPWVEGSVDLLHGRHHDHA